MRNREKLLEIKPGMLNLDKLERRNKYLIKKQNKKKKQKNGKNENKFN